LGTKRLSEIGVAVSVGVSVGVPVGVGLALGSGPGSAFGAGESVHAPTSSKEKRRARVRRTS
jgi:hypothetical protein